MKKLVLFSFILFSCFLITGCKKYGEKDVIKELKKSIEKSNEQIILRNSEGVYVLTPSLNKSFKFQSEWPYNNSQSYLLQTIIKDIENDKEYQFKESEDGYIITTKVNYSNNKDLVKQNIYINKNIQITEVHVVDNNDQVKMKMKFNSIDMKATYNDNYFDLKENMASSDFTTEKATGKINDIIYPMYLPTNTHLSSQDTVSTTSGERIILTFDGEKPAGLDDAKIGDKVTVTYTGEISEVDPFEGEVLSVEVSK